MKKWNEMNCSSEPNGHETKQQKLNKTKIPNTMFLFFSFNGGISQITIALLHGIWYEWKSNNARMDRVISFRLKFDSFAIRE